MTEKLTVQEIAERIASKVKWPEGGVGKTYQIPGLDQLTDKDKDFIVAHENLHRQYQGLPPLTWDQLFLIDDRND